MSSRARIAAPATVGALASAVALSLHADGAAAPRVCGEIKRAQPAIRARPAAGASAARRAPLAIGDSVMLNAVGRLAAAGFEVNARGCRPFVDGVRIVRARRRAGTLPRSVVIALGSNWIVPRREIDWALAETGRRRTLWLVTPREPGGGSGPDARAIRRAGREHPDRVEVLDWARLSRGHGWFYGDRLHLTPAGVRAYTRLLRRALRSR